MDDDKRRSSLHSYFNHSQIHQWIRGDTHETIPAAEVNTGEVQVTVSVKDGLLRSETASQATRWPKPKAPKSPIAASTNDEKNGDTRLFPLAAQTRMLYHTYYYYSIYLYWPPVLRLYGPVSKRNYDKRRL